MSANAADFNQRFKVLEGHDDAAKVEAELQELDRLKAKDEVEKAKNATSTSAATESDEAHSKVGNVEGGGRASGPSNVKKWVYVDAVCLYALHPG